MSEPEIPIDDIRDVLAEYGLELRGLPEPVADSVSNENFRVETGAGTLFVKRHRWNRTRERIEREHNAAAWAGAAGVPVVAPLRALHGETLLELAGRWWSVAPWVTGTTFQRGSIDAPKARVLGAVHGRLQEALRAYPAEGIPPNSELTWDTAGSLAVLDELGLHVAERGNEQERRWVAKQRALLESGETVQSSEFDWLPRQPTHGDFHERNVMLDERGEVAAIVDWERFCLQPPAFEVLRAVSFILLLEEPLLRAYLEGFRTQSKLERETIRPAIEAWRQSSMHNTWALRDVFLIGNEPPRQFLPQEEARSALFNDGEFRRWLVGMFEEFAA